MLARILALVLKELTSLWADKKTRFVLIIPPLVQVVLFANAATYDVMHVPLAVWNEDAGVQSSELIRGFTYSRAFAAGPEVFSPMQAQSALESKQAAAVLHVPQDFSADILARRTTHVQLLIDARRSNTALIVSAYASQIVSAYAAKVTRAGAGPVDIALTYLLNPSLASRWLILPALVVILSMMMTTMISALSLARERELGTFEQMLVTPLRPVEIMLGKAVPSLLVGLLEANIVLLAALLLFGVPFKGNLLLFQFTLVVFSLAGVAVGLAISSFTHTQQQAILGVFIYAAPAIVISGYASPIENMPLILQWASKLDPITYMLVISRGMFLTRLPVSLIWAQSWPMILIAVALLAMATQAVRRSVV